ncbi:zinc-binding alcohol dehydrogenase family protein [Microbacterium sp. B2969]|uniref:alcohol dehydrogenase n=1 Tax=Microbacterium alkaliflavum TaxID=3248839 RepID=A0ABW7Q6A0_9MICO
MKAWVTPAHGELVMTERPDPSPGDREVMIEVEACGICRTDLHVIDRELPEHRPSVIPGHQIVGTVADTGADVRRARRGDRVGIAWLRSTCGVCAWCMQGRENLCPSSTYTGWDEDGGFAEYAVAHEAFAYALRTDAPPAQVAPLLCAGIIGYRALSRAALPPGGSLGLYGFGSSAHLAAQVAAAAGARVFVLTRGEENRRLARELGAQFVGDERAEPPEPLDSAIVFAPAGELVPLALRATTRGGTVVLAGIHMTDVPTLDYSADLFYERDLRTVTANTRADGAAFLRLAETLRLAPTVREYAFEDVHAAIDDLRSGRARGSLVMVR